jgi:regulator of RNase E activity RraA
VDDLVQRLSTLDVCSVSDAMDALDIQGAVAGLVPLWEGARLVGRAVTVRLAEGPPPPEAPVVHLGAAAIEASRPGDVIVVDNAGRTGMGGWGGLLTLAASLRGIAGVVVDGACRDVDEARELGFPTFARAGVQRTARRRVHEEATGEPVTLAGIQVSPGDVVMADGSGVVCLPAGRAADIVARAEAIRDREQDMQQALKAGLAVSSVLGGDYERMLEPVAETADGPTASGRG